MMFLRSRWLRTLQSDQTVMQFCRADRPAESVDFVLAFRPHSDLLAKMATVSARPIYSTAGLLDWRVNRPASKPVRTYTSSVNRSMTRILEYLPMPLHLPSGSFNSGFPRF